MWAVSLSGEEHGWRRVTWYWALVGFSCRKERTGSPGQHGPSWTLPDSHRCIAGAERHAAVRVPLCLPAATAQLHTMSPSRSALIPAVNCSENRPRRNTPISSAQNTVTPTAVPPFVSAHHHLLRKPIQGLPLLCPGCWLHCVTAHHCLTLCG